MRQTKSILLLLSTLMLWTSAGAEELSGTLIVFNAGSLSVPFKQMTEAFNKIHPNVEVRLEASGSRDCARKISDLNRPCDVMASADYVVIDQLLIPKHAAWNIKFAANEMAIVYHDSSRRANEITTENWQEILMDPNVIFGRADPNSDPCGYRAIMTMKLTGKYLTNPTATEALLEKNREYIRPKEVDLLALLESNAIDYIFLYRSVAQQHGLKHLILPDEVNLKKAELADFYATATVEVSGKKPGETITQIGAPMVYGITIPNNAPNRNAALAFVDFVLGEKGKAIMEANGQPSVVPSPSETFNEIPAELKAYATEK